MIVEFPNLLFGRCYHVFSLDTASHNDESFLRDAQELN